MIAVAILLFAIGYLLLYSFFKDESPRDQVATLFAGGKKRK